MLPCLVIKLVIQWTQFIPSQSKLNINLHHQRDKWAVIMNTDEPIDEIGFLVNVCFPIVSVCPLIHHSHFPTPNMAD